MILGMTNNGAPVETTANPPAGHRPDGPPAGVLAMVSLALSLCAVVIPLLAPGTGYPTPSTSPDAVATYFTGHALVVTLTGFFTFAASVPLGIFTATVYARLLRLGIRVPGPNIAFFGGITASILLASSGLATWALGQDAAGVAGPVLRLLNEFAFALGGVGFVGGLGLLIAGIAVPSLVLRLVPRWLAWTGLVIAAASELSFLALLWSGLDVLIPIGRFGGLVWLIAVGFLLPRNRHDVVREVRS
jgi:hypothetical protein